MMLETLRARRIYLSGRRFIIDPDANPCARTRQLKGAIQSGSSK
jgi:hypothetical protein